jgi:hypothetical protein
VTAQFLLVAMEIIRSKLVITKAIPANGFVPDNANMSPFMQRAFSVQMAIGVYWALGPLVG